MTKNPVTSLFEEKSLTCQGKPHAVKSVAVAGMEEIQPAYIAEAILYQDWDRRM
jgi:hypothetical protein